MKTPKPRAGDPVKSPYARRELKTPTHRTDGLFTKAVKTAPAMGVIKSVSKGWTYIDYGVGSAFTPVPVEELKWIPEHGYWIEAL
jgi:hypothetical protein